MSSNTWRRIGAALPLLAGLTGVTTATASEPGRCTGTPAAGQTLPTPADPYPLMAAGWGPELGQGRMMSRWAEDWSGLRAAGNAPAGKAMPLWPGATLTLGAELRLRFDAAANAPGLPGDPARRALLRAVAGADLHLGAHLRAYAELASGQAWGLTADPGPNFRNAVSLQQAFVDLRARRGDWLGGAMLGRQEFADGPRQLISSSDGPNLHRSWNGARFYLHGTRLRLGAFDLRATRLGEGGFDESVDDGERLQGLNASLVVSGGSGPNTFLEPFWYHRDRDDTRIGARLARDQRDTFGLRLWGRSGNLRFDATGAWQTGRFGTQPVQAWGLFAVASLDLPEARWQPRIGARLDLASGGGSAGEGALGTFHPLYASSAYLGEGQFLALANLAMVTPSITFRPTARTELSAELGWARRLRTDEPVFAGGLRGLAGTATQPGRVTGRLARAGGRWTPDPRLSLFVSVEYFHPGAALREAGHRPGHYAGLGATFRY